MRSWHQPAATAAVPNFASVDVYASCVLSARPLRVWEVLRQWSSAPWLTGQADVTFQSFRVGGDAATEVGSTRVLQICDSQMFEQLTALDDEDTSLRWKLISHPETISPFTAASYINAVSTLRLRPITVGDNAFVEWSVRFFTEPHNTHHLHATLQSWCLIGFDNLQAYLNAQHWHSPQPYPTLRDGPAVGSAKDRRRFVGTMPDDFGQTACNGSHAAYTSGYAQPSAAPGEAHRRPEPSASAAQLSARSNPLHGRSQTKSGALPSQVYRDPLPQGPGPPLSTLSGSKMSLGSHGTNPHLSSNSSHSQSADSRTSSWEHGPPNNAAPNAKVGGPNYKDLQRRNSTAVEIESSKSTAKGATRSASFNSNEIPSAQVSRAIGLTKQKLEAYVRENDADDAKAAAAAAANAAPSGAQGGGQSDGVYMEHLAQRLEESWAERNTARSSFEEVVERLEMRQQQLHRTAPHVPAEAPPASAFSSPFASPFQALQSWPQSEEAAAEEAAKLQSKTSRRRRQSALLSQFADVPASATHLQRI